MKNKETKQIIKKLGSEERYNTCPICGGEVYLYVDDEGEYCVGCVQCEEMNTSTYLRYAPDKNEIDHCRRCWNFWAISGAYSADALKNLKVHDGEYIITALSDGYIEFAGGENDMFKFLRKRSKNGESEIYVVHNVQNGRLYNIGLSTFVDMILSHYEVER